MTLSLDTTSSTASLAVIDLYGAGLVLPTTSPTPAFGVSADLKIDSTWMAFSSFTPDTANVTAAIATPLETDPNTIVIGVYKVINPSKRIGTLKFNLTKTGQTAALSFAASSTYIGTLSSVLTNPQLKGIGGTLKN